jgi:hypothetical protein
MMARRLVVLAVVGFVTTLALIGSASAQTGYGETVAVQGGQTIRESGVGCPPGGDVTIAIDGATVATTVAASDGSWTVEVTVPTNLAPGSHTLTGSCGGQVVQVQTLTIAGAAGAPLARTGSSNTGVLVGLGLAAIVVGSSFVYGARAERRKAHVPVG